MVEHFIAGKDSIAVCQPPVFVNLCCQPLLRLFNSSNKAHAATDHFLFLLILAYLYE